MATYLVNGKIVLEQGILSDHTLIIRDGKIAEILLADELKEAAWQGEEVIDLKGGYISPGWIDIHCHGALGSDVMDGDVEGILKIAHFKATQGVVGFIPTGVTNPKSEIEKAVQAVKKAAKINDTGAEILGFHVEGPFINPVRKGAHQASLIIPVDADWTRRLLRDLPGKLIVTVAPEMPGVIEYIQEMTKEGVLIALGHSNATYAEAKRGYEAGATHAVHIFNGMREFHHREPGIVGAVMDLPLIAEVILDGIHLHPVIVRILSRAKLPEQIVLITDAMRASGLADGLYDLGGLQVHKRGKEARLADGTLAGSTLTMDEAVRNAVELVGLSLVDAVRMAATNPARLLKLESKGCIAIGHEADLTLLTPDLQIQGTLLGGRVLYQHS